VADLEVMRRIDELHMEFPFAGSRMLRGLLVGCKIGRRHVKTLMKRMGIEALYRRPRTTKPEPGHKIYPYLLRGMEIVRPNQSLPSRRRGSGLWTSSPDQVRGQALYPHGEGLRLSRGGAGLVQPASAVLARADHDGGGVLRRNAGGRPCKTRQARNL